MTRVFETIGTDKRVVALNISICFYHEMMFTLSPSSLVRYLLWNKVNCLIFKNTLVSLIDENGGRDSLLNLRYGK